MPLPSILRKASSYILGDGVSQESRRTSYQDGETLFCKNNVCVHPPTLTRQHHHPGYLTITCKYNKNSNLPTLHLSWIPNSTLRKFPTTLENNKSLREDSRDSQLPDDGSVDSRSDEKVDVCLEVKEPVHCGDCERICSGGFQKTQESLARRIIDRTPCGSPHNSAGSKSIITNSSEEDVPEEKNEGINLSRLRSESVNSRQGVEENGNCSADSAVKEQQSRLQEISLDEADKRNNEDEPILSFDNISRKSRSTSLTSNCSILTTVHTDGEEFPTWMRSPELLALQHNLTFPESVTASPVTLRRVHRCRSFSVDLSQMRSLRLFFADPMCTSGQLVVASRESQYKILHFHHGGLDRLATTLHQWHQLVYPRMNSENEESLPYRQFMVCRPEVSRDELHPEEGQVPMITSLAWKDLLNEQGQVEDDLTLRKGIFFGGLEPALRKIVWPFLLHCYSYQSTYEDREQINSLRKQEYEEIERRRVNLGPEETESFFKNVVCIVEKDVVRTDRANPFYAGENNPNIAIMKNILLNYAMYNPTIGYTQGMSDLLAPLLVELNNEVEVFWCFAGLMQRSVAVCTPTDTDMDRNLCYLRDLIKIMVPDFYSHLQRHEDALELLFCHRWILLCLKREFPTDMALTMWEACWVNYLTDHFHLFLCLAIICVYADDVIAQDLRTDEMLLHFSSLAMYMDGTVIIRKARGLLHNFRQLARIPCTLSGLCRQCGPGMWDSRHNPVIECIGHEDETCPFSENYV